MCCVWGFIIWCYVLEVVVLVNVIVVVMRDCVKICVYKYCGNAGYESWLSRVLSCRGLLKLVVRLFVVVIVREYTKNIVVVVVVCVVVVIVLWLVW